MAANDSSPAQTLAVLLGAGWYHLAPKLAYGAPFENSARDFRDYLLAPEGMSLPRENLCWLFDDSRVAAEQLRDLGDFLDRRCQDLNLRSTPATDLIVYYVGHGLFCGAERAYQFAIRATDERREGLTSLRVSELAQTLKDHARFLRRFLVLDCCFSGVAYREFQSGPLQLGRDQLLTELPSRGTTLLCAASAHDPAIVPAGLPHTMFSHSLLRSLGQGDAVFGESLSLNELGELVRRDLKESFPHDWVKPEVHSPDQREGEVAGVGLFPNPALGSVSWQVREPVTLPPLKPRPPAAAHTPAPPPAPAARAPGASHNASAEAKWQAEALLERAARKLQEGDTSGALEEYTTVIGLPGVPPEQLARARVSRALIRAQQGDPQAAMIDYTAAIELPGAPPEPVAKALVNRGTLRGQQGDQQAAIADYRAVMALPGTPTEQRARALVHSGFAKGQNGDVAGEMADYTAAITLPGAPAEQVAKALLNRGVTKGQHGDRNGAIADYTSVTLIGGLPEQVAKALYYRGNARADLGEREGALADYSAVLALPGAPVDRVAKALLRRGMLRTDNRIEELADYTAVIELPGAPPGQIASALVNRGVAKGKQGDLAGEIADYTRAIDLLKGAGAPPAEVAAAHYSRGRAREQQHDHGGAIDDYRVVIELHGAPAELAAKAGQRRQGLLDRIKGTRR